ncbi:MAG: serine/threonine protein kinase [Actinomycetota bacterium]|nr:serine/threonine protein kinase [Actinomycetota bacterium]
MLLAPEAVLGARYQLISRIAVGGMGEVWRAHDTVLKREVAVKVLKPELTGDPEFLRRFRAEARHTAGLTHRGIASVFDYGEASTDGAEGTDTAYLVMELVEGEPLSTILAREGRLSTERTLDIVGQTARALQAAHDAGVIHRDVKPGNVLVQTNGRVKITDFGIARLVDAAPVTATGMVMGTAHYLSPEQAAGQPVTPASDVYSLGVVGYEALAGQRPFAADNPLGVALLHVNAAPPPLPDDLTPAARAVVEQAMAKDPAQRFASAAAMADAAELASGGIGTAPMGTAPMSAAAMGAAASYTAARQALSPATRVLPVAAAGGAPSPRSRRILPRSPVRWPRPAVLLIGALLLVGLITLSARALSAAEPRHSTPTTPAGSTHGSTPGSPAAAVQIDPGDYQGEGFDEVRTALIQRGLRVRASFAGKDGAPGTVTDVTPIGALPVNTLVTVTVVPEPTGKKKKKEGD